ncbi:uncharacterized protein PV09_02425 [Verruconis gallopava]|uniref:Inclusion body clearance protein IML2 n=1 Tax=Verruconis gallopava TaxID=253628 RepID=A0A0D1XV97_9PEZI|nr:uncharacterized protein PV09_02425 [Verruconis gallopava]KIW06731.1 hypothetical protein PV09_02425 [Verruconis gallopava]
MFRSIFGNRSTSSVSSLSALDETKALEDAMYATSFMMDDNIERAEEELSKGNSVFHKHGKAVVVFLRAVLGFEREIMKEAQERISEAESAASQAQSHAQRDPTTSSASAYSAGTEYALILAELRLMSAITGVLTESVTEAIKSFYKLRQSYLILDAIQQEEKRYFEKTGFSPPTIDTISDTVSSSASTSSQDLEKEKQASSEVSSDPDREDSDVDFVDATEVCEEPATQKYLGRLSTDEGIENELDRVTIKDSPGAALAELRRRSSTFQDGPGLDAFGDNIVDCFIHSGSNMCFGMIQILLSMLPPAFSTLVKIAGFKGDRVRGLALLWQASKFKNINGAFAGLVLLGYYNGFVGFCDILPTRGRGAYPKTRCATLLQSFRTQYPNSRLWILEESRMLSSNKELEKAIQLLEETPDANLKQVRALQTFEKSLSFMSSHQYEPCSEGFQKCVKLNNWSHGLYYFVAGAAYVEQYREMKDVDVEKASTAKEKAEELLRKVPEHIGKRKMMGRQLPFDAFVSRKLQKWEQRATDWHCDLVDAVGVSPLEEMIYFWNGYKRMSPKHLEVSMRRLDWSTSEANPFSVQETLDEHSIRHLLRATVLRNMEKREQAREVLKEVMGHPHHEFKGGLKDNWTQPAAHYELAVTYWKEYCENGSTDALHEAKTLLDKVAAWESYDLDARIGMRVKTGSETIRKEMEAISTSTS